VQSIWKPDPNEIRKVICGLERIAWSLCTTEAAVKMEKDERKGKRSLGRSIIGRVLKDAHKSLDF
jgi:hypothetical protein